MEVQIREGKISSRSDMFNFLRSCNFSITSGKTSTESETLPSRESCEMKGQFLTMSFNPWLVTLLQYLRFSCRRGKCRLLLFSISNILSRGSAQEMKPWNFSQPWTSLICFARIFFMRVIMLNNQAWILTGSSNISGSSFFWLLRLVVKADRRRIIFFGCTEQCQGCNGPSIVYCCFYYNHSHSTKNVCICNFHEIKWVIYIVNSDCA